MKFIIPIILMLVPQINSTFKEVQLKNTRVKTAYDEKEATVKTFFETAGIKFNGFHLFLRVFKREQNLEVWVKEQDKAEHFLLKTYPFCASSGILGPKRKEGDLQIPEGVYHINRFNPNSNFYLSLGVNYPNEADKVLHKTHDPGGDIFIHGGCETIGCIPITDEKIKELYVLAVEAKNNGQQKIPVHIFPDRLDLGSVEQLVKEQASGAGLKDFWKNLQTIYLDFKTTEILKEIKVNSKGEYLIER